jgi:hypothetical protein
MSFILVPRQGDVVQVNAWNWRPTIEFLRVEGVIDDETSELLTLNGRGAQADADLARRMAIAVEHKLQSMRPGERIRGDLSMTDAPKKVAEFHKPESIDTVDLYSASYEWLVQFRDFCERCGGFKVS